MIKELTAEKVFQDQLESDYFLWLTKQVATGDPDTRSFGKLFEKLHRREFTWSVPNDDNRGVDGQELRQLFLDIYIPYEDNSFYISGPCSVLEMMVALAVKCEHNIMRDPELGDRTHIWFWNSIRNLGLGDATDDEFTNSVAKKVDDAIDMLLNRTYSKDGTGGMYPLKHPTEDQRTVEICYQESAYLIENYQ